MRNFKWMKKGYRKKEMWLPASDPADGQPGADVLVAVDPAVRSVCMLGRVRSCWQSMQLMASLALFGALLSALQCVCPPGLPRYVS